MRSPFRSRTVLIVPMVLVVVSLLQDIATYKVRQHVRSIEARAAIILALTGVGFAFAGDWLGPRLKQLLTTARKTSSSSGGPLGIWVFYALAYGALFYAYVLVERRGIAALLPASLR